MEAKQHKYSRKREAIRDVLMNTKSHPGADWIYSQLKGSIPDLSLATVYRNLSEMKQNGEVQSVAVIDGKERFDGNVKKHTHFVCDVCGKIDDLDFVRHDAELDEKARSEYDGLIEYHELVFHGKCKDCKNKLS